MTEILESIPASKVESEEMVNGEVSLLITTGHDILNARQKTRWFAEQIGFRGSWPTILSTVISELARNILESARHGSILIQSVRNGNKKGILIKVTENSGRGQFIRDQAGNNAPWSPLTEIASVKFRNVRRVADGFEIGYDREGDVSLKVLKWL